MHLLEACIRDIDICMVKHKLKQIGEKTEVLCTYKAGFSSKHYLRPLQIGGMNKYIHIIVQITNKIHIINPFLMLYYLFKGTLIYLYYVVYMFIRISNLLLLCYHCLT